MLAFVIVLFIATAAEAQQRRTTPPAAPAIVRIWDRDTLVLQQSFDRHMMQLRYTTRMDPIVCDVTAALLCEVAVRSVDLRLRGTAEPERVQEVRVEFTSASPFNDVAMVVHALMAIAEPQAPEAERRTAILRLLGIDSPNTDRVIVGGTEARFMDGFRRRAFVFRPVT
jgi:endonuclease YncB( thermonuclease family)